MHATKSPINPVSRPRSRSQWDEYYRNRHDEMRKKRQNGGIDKGSGNVVDSESIIGDGDGDIVMIDENRSNEGNIEQAENSGRRGYVKGTRNGGEGVKDNNVASVGRISKGKRKLDLRAKNDDDDVLKISDDDVLKISDDDVEYLGEEVVSNGSSLKIRQESRSGSELKVVNLHEVVSNGSSLKNRQELSSGSELKVGNLDEVLSNGSRLKMDQDLSYGSELKAVNSDEVVSNGPHDASIDSENVTDSGSSIEGSDGSDMSADLSESEDVSTSEEDNEFSDEDYNADETSADSDSDDDSDVPYCLERRIDDENDCLMVAEEENSINTIDDRKTVCSRMKSRRMTKERDIEENDESDGGENGNGDDDDNQQKHADVTIVNGDKEKPPLVRKSTRVCGEKESNIEQRDDKIDEGYCAVNEDSGQNKTTGNCKIDNDEVIAVSNKENHPRTMQSTRICNVSKKVNDNLNKSVLKKRKVPGFEILVDCEKKSDDMDYTNVAKHLRLCTVPKSLDKGHEVRKYSVPIPTIKNMFEKGQQCSNKRSRAARELDLIKILLESINSLKEEQSYPVEESATLPLKFRFEDTDNVQPPLEKSEWEKQMDSLFCDLELGLRESEIDSHNSAVSEIDCTKASVMENDDPVSTVIDKSPAACCSRGEHQSVLDEQIGIVCKYCSAVILDIKYVLPPFYKPPLRRRDWKDDSDESPSSIIDQIKFHDTACRTPGPTTRPKGTVWDLIPGVEEQMYPHQREGFEFIWKNIAGDIVMENLEHPLSNGGSGCIISHAPGTGKTRLTIVFIQTFLKLYPTFHPVIIAPRGMLLTWECEFKKWKVDIPFHNLNKKELSGNENALAINIFGQVGMSRDYIRLLKLYSWMKGRSVLGISYQLFEKLAGENGKQGQIGQFIKKRLLDSPDLLVLDEGHTPRNDQSEIWKAVAKVATMRRIILSGTPFQNNLAELYNTLCLVNPIFANQMESKNMSRRMARKKWMNLTSSIGTNTEYDGLRKLRAMLDPFVHVHRGTILEESLPGLSDTLVFLQPTELQKTLLETASKEHNLFHRIHLISMVSVHPSISACNADASRLLSSPLKSKLEEIESDIDAGVKTKFVMKLIRLAGALGERVLVFSQWIDTLVFMKKQIESRFSWNEGREVLYLDGKLDEKQRQDSISSFNDDKSEAKVLLASKRACSEGINLIGASRVVLLDTMWNPSVERQAISRAYRLGQKRVVYVYRLFTSGTEVGQYSLQVQKERLSQLIFSTVDGRNCGQSKESPVVYEDKVLESIVDHKGFNHIFEKIIHQPKESDLIEIFGLVDR